MNELDVEESKQNDQNKKKEEKSRSEEVRMLTDNEKRRKEELQIWSSINQQQEEFYAKILKRYEARIRDTIAPGRRIKALKSENIDIFGEIALKFSQESPNLMFFRESPNDIQTLCSKPKKNNQSCEIYSLESIPSRESNTIKKIDSEKRELVEQTEKYPNSAIGLIKFEDGNLVKTGTGFLFGPDLVLTAAHNLCDFNDKSKRKYTNIEFYPGMNEQTAVFGKCKIIEIFIPNENLEVEDYAVGILDRPVGNNTGYFGLHIATKGLLSSKELFVFGYPGYVRNKEGNLVLLSQNKIHQQWGMKGKSDFFEEVDSQINYSNIMTSPGQSGSPVYYHDDKTGNWFAIGVHIQGREDFNTATWITINRFTKIKSWIKQLRDEMLFRITDQFGEENVSVLDLSYSTFWWQICDCCRIPRCPFTSLKQNYTKEELEHLALKMPNLKELNLNGCQVGHEVISFLSQSSIWTKLRKLHFYMNCIGNLGAASLSSNKTWINLQVLDLENNDIGDQGAIELGKNRTWTNLTCLNIERNKIGDLGTLGLSKNEKWENLTILKLNDNLIGDQGIIALISNRIWKKLSEIDLRSNQITDLGISVLSNKNRAKINLCLGCNKVSYQGRATIQELGWTVTFEPVVSNWSFTSFEKALSLTGK